MMKDFPKHERGPHRGQYLDPQGQLVGTFQQLMEAGCIQAETPALEPIFHLLMRATNQNPCNGCPVWGSKGPECEAFQQYHSAYALFQHAEVVRQQEAKEATMPHNVPVDHPLAGLSVRQIAAKLGVSIGEVRRRKINGTL